MTWLRGFALAFAILFLALTGSMAAELAHGFWVVPYGTSRGLIVWPIALFCVIATSLAGCFLTRDTTTRIVALLATGGAFVVLLFLLALSGAS